MSYNNPSTFEVLIPKVVWAYNILITLVGSIYKLVAEVVVRRLNKVIFTISLYHYLAGLNSDRQRTFPSKIIWKSGAPPRISFFAWEAAKEKILTLDNLMKRGYTTVNRCIPL